MFAFPLILPPWPLCDIVLMPAAPVPDPNVIDFEPGDVREVVVMPALPAPDVGDSDGGECD